MKNIVLAIAILALSAPAMTANASTASQREYKRGYSDCAAGRYDQNQHGASYKKGCRAAEDAAKKGSAPAAGTTASEREYKRGYDDCAAGRYDQNQHGASYKKGCRAAEDAAKGSAPAKDVCPPDVSEANRYQYPACN